ncbi:MAG TPA: GNAT family N-acetyltransferase [Patescibacteria group bacterium]|nr:GNAT family N-acetyltransferase [Patescibacteria group bacterium]
MKNNILVVVAHPDDEILGVGGTILRCAKRGDDVTILILSNGETSRMTAVDITKRTEQAKKVAATLGAKNIVIDQFPDQKFDTVPLLDIIQKIESVMYNLNPKIVYTHCPYDLNIDHRLTFQAVLTACRPGFILPVKKILTFETPSSTEWNIKDQANSFCPTEYNDITDLIDEKIDVLKIYGDELREYPHPRSIEGIKVLAQYRGMEVGYKYAEAFQVLRILNDSSPQDEMKSKYCQEELHQYFIEPAQEQDSERILEIRNNPIARKFSDNPDVISLTEHDEWFKRKYFGDNKENFCFVLKDKEKKVIGYCRLDFNQEKNGYVISIAIDSSCHSRGLGHYLLSEFLKKSIVGENDILMEVKRDNLHSIKLFRNNNFKMYKEDSENYYFKYNYD